MSITEILKKEFPEERVIQESTEKSAWQIRDFVLEIWNNRFFIAYIRQTHPGTYWISPEYEEEDVCDVDTLEEAIEQLRGYLADKDAYP